MPRDPASAPSFCSSASRRRGAGACRAAGDRLRRLRVEFGALSGRRALSGRGDLEDARWSLRQRTGRRPDAMSPATSGSSTPATSSSSSRCSNGCGTNGHYWFFSRGPDQPRRHDHGDGHDDPGSQDLLESPGSSVRTHPRHGGVCELPGSFLCSLRCPGTSSRREAPKARPSGSRRE